MDRGGGEGFANEGGDFSFLCDGAPKDHGGFVGGEEVEEALWASLWGCEEISGGGGCGVFGFALSNGIAVLAFGLCGKGEESEGRGFEDDFLQFDDPDGAVAFCSEGGEVYYGFATTGAAAFRGGRVLSEAVGEIFFSD
jgi:hypothetical protein